MTVTVLTPPQIAARWKCKPETARKLLETGQLVGFKISPTGAKRPRWRVTLDAVLAYEAGEKTLAQPTPRPRRRPARAAAPVGPF